MAKKVAMVLANNFEDSEAIDPKNHLESLGAEVVTIGETRGTVEGKKGGVLEVERTFDEVTPDEFDMLVIPGGGAPENLRIVDQAVAFTRRFVESGKPVGSICHGPQLLISAKVLDGRTVTSVKKIRDDVMNAGAQLRRRAAGHRRQSHYLSRSGRSAAVQRGAGTGNRAGPEGAGARRVVRALSSAR